MASPLNLFSARVPIGRAVGPDGRTVDVLMTPEFARALADLLVRVGGPSSINLNDIATLAATEPVDTAGAAALRALSDLALQLAAAEQATAKIAALERRVEDLARLVNSSGPAPVDWEHPGKIGAAKANTAKFTAATVTTLNKLTFTQPANGATFTLTDGKTFAVKNFMELRSVDGAFLDFGMGGTLGSAAYKGEGDAWAMGKFGCNGKAAQASAALPAAATDPATTQALANSIRAALIANGIGS